MFGISFDKVLVIAVLAVFLLGPERLPHYASQLAKLVRSLRQMADGAKDRLRDEMGPDFDDVDWKKLDPRQYDPRRIIREALLDDAEDENPVVKPVSSGGPIGSAFAQRQKLLADGRDAPFDSEAT
ncbi:twin-arginine translocase TatA/TatE family subunit [soil metagenome]